MKTRRNEFEVTVDSNRVPHLDLLVRHDKGEIWATISLATRQVESIGIWIDGEEFDIKSEVMDGWRYGSGIRTTTDLMTFIDSMKAWSPPEPDYEEIHNFRQEWKEFMNFLTPIA